MIFSLVWPLASTYSHALALFGYWDEQPMINICEYFGYGEGQGLQYRNIYFPVWNTDLPDDPNKKPSWSISDLTPEQAQ